MAAYLIVDVDDLLRFTSQKGIDLQELAVAMRGQAPFTAGLFDSSYLSAVAIADWQSHIGVARSLDPRAIFRNAGYEIVDLALRSQTPDQLMEAVFESPPAPRDEIIIATTSRDLLPFIVKIRLVSKRARPRLGRRRELARRHELRR